MYLSKEAYQKYSLFGTFENQLKHNELNLNENKLEILPFLNFTDRDVNWYHSLVDKMIDKPLKLQPSNIKYEMRKKYQPTSQATTSKLALASLENEAKLESIDVTDGVSYLEDQRPKQVTPVSDFKIEESKEKEIPSLAKESINEKLDSKVPIMPKKNVIDIEEKTKESLPAPSAASGQSKHQPSISNKNTNQNQANTRQERPQQSLNYPWMSDRRSVSIMRNWYPLRFKLNYPKKSRLTSFEQKDFIDLYTKFRNRTHLTQKEVKFYKLYMHYKNLIEKERTEFLNYSQRYYENAKEDYDFVNQTALQYINEMFTYSESICLNFDKYYTKLEELSLPLLESSGHGRPSVFESKKNLVQLGNLPKIVIPSITMSSQPPLAINYNLLSKRAPVAKSNKNSKIPLSVDENAKILALKYNINFVMTNSAFVSLIYHLSSENCEDLKLPVIVKIFKKEDGTSEKVVFIEKPLISKHPSKREKNEKFYKRALMVTVVKNPVNIRHKATIPNIADSSKQPKDSSNKPIQEKIEKKPDNNPINDGSSALAPVDARSKLTDFNIEPETLTNYESFGISESNPDSNSHKVSTETNSQAQKRQHETSTSSSSSGSNSHDDIEDHDKNDDNNSATKENNVKKPKLEETSETNKTDKYENDAVESSDYEDYGDEDSNLVIVDSNKDSDQLETPESPKNMDSTSSKPKMSPVIESPNKNLTTPTSFENIKPKVIPLDSLTKSNISTKSAIESNGLTETKPTTSEVSKVKEEKTENAADSTKSVVESKESPSLFDLISKMQEKLINPSSSSTSTKTSAQHMLASLMPSTKYEFQVENPKDYTFIENRHENLCYNLWSCNSNPPTQIIFRLSIDGYINTESSSVNSVVLHPKLEYQPQFGCEKLSHKDYCKMWAKSYIRNMCDVILCRINVFTNKLISITNISHKDILSGHPSFNPQQTLNSMRSFLEKLNSLNEGNYLVTKEPNENKLTIMKSSGSKGSYFDLHNYHLGFEGEKKEQKSNWIPIDNEFYLPYHFQLSRVPGLFEPDHQSKNNNKTKKHSKKKRKGGNTNQQAQGGQANEKNPPKK